MSIQTAPSGLRGLKIKHIKKKKKKKHVGLGGKVVGRMGDGFYQNSINKKKKQKKPFSQFNLFTVFTLKALISEHRLK